MKIKLLIVSIVTSFIGTIGVPLIASAASNVVTPSSPQSWTFNPDPTTATPLNLIRLNIAPVQVAYM